LPCHPFRVDVRDGHAAATVPAGRVRRTSSQRASPECVGDQPDAVRTVARWCCAWKRMSSAPVDVPRSQAGRNQPWRRGASPSASCSRPRPRRPGPPDPSARRPRQAPTRAACWPQGDLCDQGSRAQPGDGVVGRQKQLGISASGPVQLPRCRAELTASIPFDRTRPSTRIDASQGSIRA
jgi:hypothetical protein